MTETTRIVTTSARHLAVTRNQGTSAEIGPIMNHAFGIVMGYLSQTGIPTSGPAVARFVMREDGFDIAAGFPVAEAVPGDGVVVPLELPAAEVATITHLGAYDAMPITYDRLRTEVAEVGRRLDEVGPMWEEYWSESTTAPDETRTEVFWPLLPA